MWNLCLLSKAKKHILLWEDYITKIKNLAESFKLVKRRIYLDKLTFFMISNWHWPFSYSVFVLYLFYDVCYYKIYSHAYKSSSLYMSHKTFVYFKKRIFPTGIEN